MVVLYVDPSSEVRNRRTHLLAKSGLTVYEADGAEAAVGVAQQLKELDVLVTEGVLDGEFTGFDVRDAIAQKFPALRSIFTSRYDLAGLEEVVKNDKVLFEPLDEAMLVSRVTQGHDGAVPAAVAEAPAPEAVAPAEPNLPVVEEASPPAPAAPAEAEPLATTDVSSPAEATEPAVAAHSAEEIPATAEASPTDDGEPRLQPGTSLGNYIIKERLYAERDTETYLALQGAVQRQVALVLLKPELVPDLEAVERFRERSRLKASISHPRIAPLYEAIETDGLLFYTREMPHGRSLDDIILSGAKYEEKELADIVAGVSEAMSTATLRGYHYRMPTPRDIFLDELHEASVVNVFRPPSNKPRDHAADVGRFLMMLRPLCHGPRARHLVDELLREHLDWEGLRHRAAEFQAEHRQRSLLRRADTKEAHEIQAAALAARANAAPPRWGRALAAIFVLGILGFGWRVWQERPSTSARPLPEELVKVPAGEFLYGVPPQEEHRTLPDFWIDKTEVTIAQYEEFLQALEQVVETEHDPKKAKQYDHPDQPATLKSHRPEDWAKTLAAARSGGYINNQRVDLNCPAVDVTWWDAFAYARWKGHHLPTEEQWEKAARGPEGRHYPWGEKDDPGAANLKEASSEKGGDKAHTYAEPVNRHKKDVSFYGVLGMAGNVEEWTGSWVNHPDYPDVLVPVVRGGDFATKSRDGLLTDRVPSKSPDQHTLLRGFRTVSDKAPPPPTPKS